MPNVMKEASRLGVQGRCCSKIILNDDPMNKFAHCPKVNERTYLKCCELLAEVGHQI